MKYLTPLKSETELLERCQTIEGLSFAQLAAFLGLNIPTHPLQRKGWVGKAIELALGTTAGNQSVPDFNFLGIELKTIPVNHLGKSIESTFVTHIPLLTIHEQTWQTSQCLAKLQRILWIPIEGDTEINFLDRRIGRAILWSPSSEDLNVLERDWNEFVLLISTGRLSQIDGRMGEYLQIRPKASDSKALCDAFDETGSKVQTLPRGFYLRARFTKRIL